MAAALYDYAQRRLVEANAANEPGPLREVDQLLGEIETAWNAMASNAVASANRSAGVQP